MSDDSRGLDRDAIGIEQLMLGAGPVLEVLYMFFTLLLVYPYLFLNLHIYLFTPIYLHMYLFTLTLYLYACVIYYCQNTTSVQCVLFSDIIFTVSYIYIYIYMIVT